jgi:hypothetical protein
MIQFGVEIAHRPRAAVECHCKAVRLVADALDEQQSRIVRRERNRIVSIAREQQLFLLGNPDGHQIREPERLERRVRSRELALATVDQNQIRERSSLFEQFPIAAQDDFVHGGEVVMHWRRGPTPAAN